MARSARPVLAGVAALALIPLGVGLRGPLSLAGAAEPPPPTIEHVQSPLLDGLPDDGLNRFIVELGSAAVAADRPATGDIPTASDGEGRGGLEWLNDASNPLHLPQDQLGAADRALLEQLQGVGDATADVTEGAAPPDDAPPPGIADLLAVAGIEAVTPAGQGFLAVTTSLSAEALAELPGVAAVTENPVRMLVADYYGYQWPLANTAVPGADIRWEEARTRATGAGTVVAVIDTGIDLAHPDLAGQLWTNAGEVCGNGSDDDRNGFIDDCHGYDFANGDGTVDDAGADNTHGTHVAGTIAAADDRNGTVGVAPDARIMALKVFHNGGTSSSRIAAAVDYAVANGADVINMSLGGYGTSAAEDPAMTRASAAGVVLVAALGNDGRDITTMPFYPAAYDVPTMIAVASTDQHDVQSGFSNYSATLADLHAPGSMIASTVPGGWAYLNGTSMAAPHVSGVAALVVQRGGDGAGVRHTIMQSTTPRESLSGRSLTGGRLDAAAAVGIPVDVDADLAMEFTSVHDATPDATDQASITITGTPDALGTTTVALRGTVGMVHEGRIYGVSELPLTIDGRAAQTDGAAQVTLTEAESLTEAQLAALADGLDVALEWTLPAGRYLLLIEAFDPSSGDPLGTPDLVAFTVATPAPAPPAGPDAPTTPDEGEEAPAPAPSDPPPAGPSDPAPDPGDPPPPAPGDPTPGPSDPPPPGPSDPPPPGSSTPPPADDGPTTPPGGTDGQPGDPPGDAAPPDPVAPPPASGTPGTPDTPEDGAGPGPDGGPTDGTPTPAPAPGPGEDPAPEPAPDGDVVPGEPDGPTDLTVAGLVSPSSGRHSGGTSAQVTVPHGIPDGAYIHFGGRNATVISQTSTQASVIVPSHAPGVVDVVVIAPNGNRLTVPDAYTYTDSDGSVPTPGPQEPAPDPGDGGDATPAPGPDSTPPPGDDDQSPPEDAPPPEETPSPGPSPAPTPPPESAPPPGSDAAPPEEGGPLTVNGLTLVSLPSSSPLARVNVSQLPALMCTAPACQGWTV